MTAEMNAPRLIRWPLIVEPRPFPAAPPPPAALTKGVMMLSVKALIKVLKASATTRPTAMMIDQLALHQEILKAPAQPEPRSIVPRPVRAGC